MLTTPVASVHEPYARNASSGHQTIPKSNELCRIQRLSEEIGNLVVPEGQNLTALGAFASFTFKMSSRPSPRTARTKRKVVHVLGELGLGLDLLVLALARRVVLIRASRSIFWNTTSRHDRTWNHNSGVAMIS